ncbi:MAG: FHA domain-containing protein [Gemmatimonadota bacterium]|nr:FHA domain-containing protein [Gemmatimonadota bacterium]
MPFIFLGRDRFALPIGATRIGGAGEGALPFPELSRHATVAVVVLAPDGAVSLSPLGGGSVPVTVNGAPVAAASVTLTHGATIEAAGLRLVLGDLDELRAPTEVTTIRDEQPALAENDGPAQPTADSGGQLVACGSGAATTVWGTGLVIGRAPDSDLVIPGRDVSRRHAVIRPSRQGYVLRDLSTNGTYVNGRRVAGSQVLGMGDIIRIGDEELRFEADPATLEHGAEPPRVRQASPPGAATPAYRSLVEPPTAPRTSAVLLATLEVIDGGALEGTKFRLEHTVIRVGRDPGNDVRLEDRTVSGSHAMLLRRDSAWVLVDRTSTNGTYVDGERVSGERQLAGVAKVRFGGITAVFRTVAQGDPS